MGNLEQICRSCKNKRKPYVDSKAENGFEYRMVFLKSEEFEQDYFS